MIRKSSLETGNRELRPSDISERTERVRWLVRGEHSINDKEEVPSNLLRFTVKVPTYKYQLD